MQRHSLEDWMEKGYQALGVMEKHLATHRFFAAGRFTIADIALYAYTHIAHEAGIDMAAHPAIGLWLARVESTDGFVNDLQPYPANALVTA